MQREERPLNLRSHPHDRLTAREHDVLTMVASGLSNRAIADRLRIAEKTVEYRLTCIFANLHVTSRTQAALRAIQQGLISLEDLGKHLMRES